MLLILVGLGNAPLWINLQSVLLLNERYSHTSWVLIHFIFMDSPCCWNSKEWLEASLWWMGLFEIR